MSEPRYRVENWNLNDGTITVLAADADRIEADKIMRRSMPFFPVLGSTWLRKPSARLRTLPSAKTKRRWRKS